MYSFRLFVCSLVFSLVITVSRVIAQAPDNTGIPVNSPAPSGAFAVNYVPGAINPYAGQNGALVLCSATSSIPIATLEAKTIGVRSSEIHWSPDSRVVVVIDHYGRTDTVIFAAVTPTGWVVTRNPAAKTQISVLGPDVNRVSREKTTFDGWVNGSAKLNLQVVFRGSEKVENFAYQLNSPSGQIDGWTQLP